ncbi:hypothetical protein ACNHKD_02235 [Methylocystis sp. JAN1]|uniref:hypothetical protein n=1 Tax=Methylocystis sp. JAN1 TaxID=3397211 RepID=UPI003FA2E16B
MLESVRQYFQDWSDACEYANECAPDLSFLGNGEPFTALLFIAAACYLAWAANEARIHRRGQAPTTVSAPANELKTVVAQMQQAQAAPEKLAA